MSKYAKLDPKKTLFLLCDVQEKFRKAIPLFSNMVQNIGKLLRVGRAFDVPLIVTEQYPKGLGNTVKELDISKALAVIPKSKFSMYVPEMVCYMKEFIPSKPEDVVLFGLETHVCVLQTSIDFIGNNYNVHIVADCIASRLNQDRDIALALLRQMGCFVQTSETIIFNLLQDMEGCNFDTVKKEVKAQSMDMELGKVPSKKPSAEKKAAAKKPPAAKVPEKKSLESSGLMVPPRK